jgi:hypothetical protein
MSETKPTGFTNVSDLFADRNFQLLLANMGRSMVPEGYAGRVIGDAAANLIQSQAAQEAGEKLLNEDADTAGVTKKLGQPTPRGTPGLNSVTRKTNGSLDIDIEHPNMDRLVASLGGYSPLGQEGVNSVTRRPSGSLLVNYDPPNARTPISAEIDALASAPTASRDVTRLSYAPTSQRAVQADIDNTLDAYLGRRRAV